MNCVRVPHLKDVRSFLLTNTIWFRSGILLLPCFWGLACSSLFAQAAELEDRTVPGFSVTDSAIMSIDHMAPNRATALTLFSTLRKDDLLPRDVAVEVLPFLSPRGKEQSQKTILARYKDIYEPSFGTTLLRYLGLSLSISQDVDPLPEGPANDSAGRADPTDGNGGNTPSTGTDLTLSQVSMGIRTFLIAGRSKTSLKEKVDSYAEATRLLDEAAATDNTRSRTADEERIISDRFAVVQNLLRDIAEENKNRVGFLLETGAATVLQVKQHTLSEGRAARWAYWINPMYRWDRQNVDLAGIARFISEPSTDSETFDLGARFGVRSSNVYYSFESIGRWRHVQNRDIYDDLENARQVAGITYAFNESVQINFTFGKNFKFDFSHGGTFLASFGLRIGLGTIPLGLPTGQ